MVAWLRHADRVRWSSLDALDEGCAQSRSELAMGLISTGVARLARMRSLLIMMGEESTSRRWRPMLYSLSLRYPDRPQARIALMTVCAASSEASTLVSVIRV